MRVGKHNPSAHAPSPLLTAPLLPRLPAAPAGLSLLNISLDTLQPDRFVSMTRRQGHDRVLASIHRAVELGFDPGAPPQPLSRLPVRPDCSSASLPQRARVRRMLPALTRPHPPPSPAPHPTPTPTPAVKVNVVVMRELNEDEVPAFVELTRAAPINVRRPRCGTGPQGRG